MVTIIATIIMKFILFFPTWLVILCDLVALFMDALCIWRLIK